MSLRTWMRSAVSCGMGLAWAVSIAGADDRGKAAGPGVIGDKTMVAWVAPADLDGRGAGVLSLVEPEDESFDAIVLGEKLPRRWMAGSEFFRRTAADQEAWPSEHAAPGSLIQVAIVYRGREVTIVRDGVPLASYREGRPRVFDGDPVVLIGLRCLGSMGPVGHFAGAVEEARLYGEALEPATIAALRPGREDGPRPLGRWTFEDGTAADSAGTFPPGVLRGGARIDRGRLQLDGKTGYVVVPSSPPGPQWMFYRARKPETGRTWDTWLHAHDGKFYLFYLAQGGPQWDNISMAVSADGVHWEERGRVLSKAEGVTWMGTGSTWKSPRFAEDRTFLLNFSEWRGPRQTIFFAASDDLLHWARLPGDLEFRQDERWYERDGRWDCIYTVPRPAGGLFGYWTATPRKETGGRFGFGRSLDGRRWEALPPPRVEGAGEGEVGAVEPVAGRYYMMFGTGGKMITLVAERPEGPFRAASRNRVLLAGSTYFSRFFPTPGGLLVNHHAIAKNGPVYLAPLKRAAVDAEGTMRLAWWEGNEALKHRPIALAEPTVAPSGESASPALSPTRLDAHSGAVLEGTIALPTPASPSPCGLYVECAEESGAAVLVDGKGVCRAGPMAADGRGFRAEEVADRERPFPPVARFRLLVKGVMMEFYLDDIFMCCQALPARATGRVGVLDGGRPGSVRLTGAWR